MPASWNSRSAFVYLLSAPLALGLAGCAANVDANEPVSAVASEALSTLNIRWSVSAAGKAVAFAPDGKSIVTGSSTDVVQQLSAVDGHQLKTFRIRGSVNAAAFSPDGTFLVEGSSTGPLDLRMYRVADGTQPFPEKSAHANQTTTVAFSPTDSTLFASGGRDKTVGNTKIWNTAGTLVHSLDDGHRVFGVAFSPDGQKLVSNASGTLHIWRVSDGALLLTMTSVSSSGVAYSPDGRYVTTGRELFDATTGAFVRNLTTTSDREVDSLTFNKDGTVLIVGSTTVVNGTAQANIRYIRVSDSAVLANFDIAAASGYVNSIALSPDGKSIVFSVATANVTLLAASPF